MTKELVKELKKIPLGIHERAIFNVKTRDFVSNIDPMTCPQASLKIRAHQHYEKGRFYSGEIICNCYIGSESLERFPHRNASRVGTHARVVFNGRHPNFFRSDKIWLSYEPEPKPKKHKRTKIQ